MMGGQRLFLIFIVDSQAGYPSEETRWQPCSIKGSSPGIIWRSATPGADYFYAQFITVLLCQNSTVKLPELLNKT